MTKVNKIQKFYVENENWKEKSKVNYYINEDAKVSEFINGLILPLRRTEYSKNTVSVTYAGGVADEKGNFVAGLTRDLTNLKFNYNCNETYKLDDDSKIKTIDEIVVFGGVLFKFFGHVMLDSITRLWWAVENSNSNYKFVFLRVPNQEFWCYDFFSLLGIPKERILIIEEPTKFKKIIVPEEALHSQSGYKKQYFKIIDTIRDSVKPSNYKKVYFTRTGLKDTDCVNEKYFENFYEKRGFKIISPEKYSVKEQISIVSGAEEIVCTIGTLSHHILFANKNTRLTILCKTNVVLKPQAIINQIKNIDISVIDVYINLLPTTHVRGCFLLYPSKYWIEYLNDNKIKYSEDEVYFDIKNHTYDYLINWTRNYSIKIRYERIKNKDIFDVIDSLSRVFYQKELSRKIMEKKGGKSKVKLIKENESLRKEISKLKGQNIKEVNLKSKKKSLYDILRKRLRKYKILKKIYSLFKYKFK